MESGNLVFASSDNSKEHFSEILTEMGVLDANTLAEVKASLVRGESLGKKLKERNIASPKHLAQALKQQITNIVDLVMTTENGECLIQEGSLPPKVPKLKIQVIALVIRSFTGSKAAGFLDKIPSDHLITKKGHFEEVLDRLHFPNSYTAFITYVRQHDEILAKDVTDHFGWDHHFTHGLLYIFKLLDIVSFHPVAPREEVPQVDVQESFFDMDIKEPGLPEMGSLEEFNEDTYSPPELDATLSETDSSAEVAQPPTSDVLSLTSLNEAETPDETTAGRRFRETADRIDSAPEDMFRNDLDPLVSAPDLQIGAYQEEDAAWDESKDLPPLSSAFEDAPAEKSAPSGDDVPTETPSADAFDTSPEAFDERDTIPRAPIEIEDPATALDEDPESLQPGAPLEPPPGEYEHMSDTQPGLMPAFQQELPPELTKEPEEAAEKDIDTAATAPMDVIYPDPEDNQIIAPQKPANSKRWLLVALPLLLVLVVFFFYQAGYLDIPLGNDTEPPATVADQEPQAQAPVKGDTGSEDDLSTLATTDEPMDEGPQQPAGGESTTSATDQATKPVESEADSEVADEPSYRTAETLPEPEPEDPREPLPTAKGDITDVTQASIERFRSNGNPYSIAIMLACEEETVNEFLESHPGEDIYVFPRQYNGRSCYDLAWGSFASKAEAGRGMSSIPGSLKSAGSPWIKQFPQYL